CLKKRVQLLVQLLAHRVLFLFSHRDGCLRFQCLESCLLQFIPHARGVVAFTFGFCLCLRGLQLLTVSSQTFFECLSAAGVGECFLLRREFHILTCHGDEACVLGGLRRLPGGGDHIVLGPPFLTGHLRFGEQAGGFCKRVRRIAI